MSCVQVTVYPHSVQTFDRHRCMITASSHLHCVVTEVYTLLTLPSKTQGKTEDDKPLHKHGVECLELAGTADASYGSWSAQEGGLSGRVRRQVVPVANAALTSIS